MLSRRMLLGAALALPVGALVGCGESEPPTPECGPFEALPVFDTAGRALLVSEASGRPGPMPMDPRFHAQLGAWFDHHTELVPGPDQLWLWPPMQTEDCTWSAAGRSVALTRLRQGREDRLDLRNAPTDKVYWAFIAGLSRYFSGVDGTEVGRVVLDNQWPLDAPDDQTTGPFTTFREDNPHQVRTLQGICAVIHGHDVKVDGYWNGRTKAAVNDVLNAAGLDGNIEKTESWQGLLEAAERSS